MFHANIGNLGHLSIIISLVTALLSAIGYYITAHKTENDKAQQSWKNFSKYTFYLHSFAVLSIITCLFIIIYNHYYEYYYAWSHSSNSLPVHFMISCFWEGQEGSFLLWMFWHCVLGIILLNTQKKWEAPMMAVFAFVQAFLASMILGIAFGDIKIGSSPFILLRDFMVDAPIFQLQPEFVPKDGTGLNPLLQNYWMVIHPPTLFLGFASTLVPFSFCIAGLVKKDFSSWIKPTLPWAHFSAMILGIGILMGAYWAYETLNFGGYWNWDPVENAVYVPWLVLVAAIHGMLIAVKNGNGLKSAIVLVISSYILILYSTFLTRSGILGNASVHSFTDLGLSGQLLIYLLSFVLLAIILCAKNWKFLPKNEKETSVWSSDFWIFMGILSLCIAAFQVISTTSIPVYNAILQALGISSNLALPADQIEHFSKYQLWVTGCIAIFSGIGNYFYWKKINTLSLQNQFYTPILLTIVFTTVSILIFSVNKPQFIYLLFASIFSIASNGIILIHIFKTKPSLSGGAVAHLGVALMLIGVLFSAGYSKVVSQNTTGLLYSKEFTTQMNQENTLLFRNEKTQIGDYQAIYKGVRIEAIGFSNFIDKEITRQTGTKNKAVLIEDLLQNNITVAKIGDTISYMSENTFYEIEMFIDSSKSFTIYPRAQVNKEMGLLASPDVKKMGTKDLYAHVSSIPDPAEDREWSELEVKQLAIGDTFLVNDYYAILEKVQRIYKVDEFDLGENDAAVQAYIKILGKDNMYYINPTYVIHRQMVGRISEDNLGLGIRLTLMDIDPKAGKFSIGMNTTQKDWVILKAMEKPGIDLLWGGSIMVVIGFVMSIIRRKKTLV